VISGFRREEDESFDILGHYAASSGNLLPTVRDKLSVPFPGIKDSEDGTIFCPEASVRNHHYSLLNNPEDRCSLLRMQTGTTEVLHNDINKDFTHKDTVLTRWVTNNVSRKELRKGVGTQTAVQFSLDVSARFRHTKIVTSQNFAAAVFYLSTLTKLICFSTLTFCSSSAIRNKR
jgi:hypothetical protein